MANDDVAALVAKNQFLLQQLLPSLLPTIYSDGVANLSRGPGVVKFYMIRFEPDRAGTPGPYPQVPAAQIVMTSIGFAATVLFFQQQLALMVANNEIPRELYDQLVVAAGAQTSASQKNADESSPH